MKVRSSIKRKLVMLLLGGLALSLSRSPKQHIKILKEISKELKGNRKNNINRAINSLRKDGFIEERKNSDGTIQIVLSKKGKRQAEIYSIDDIKIKHPAKWDGNWRVVMFDVPEKFKKVRESLRMHLRNIGFLELQKSVFVYPFPCLKEVSEIANFYNARKNIRLLVANSIDNENELKKEFGL